MPTAATAMASSTCTTTARCRPRRWSASRRTCRRSAPPSATGEPGRHGRRCTDPRPTSRWSCARRAARACSRTSAAGCHGIYGNGRTTADTKSSTNFNAAYHFLNPQPRDFTTGAFKSRTTPSGALPTDEDIFRTISRGVRKGQIMPAWGNAADGHVIPEQDRWDLVDYVKTLSPRFKSEPVPDAIPDSGAAVSHR